MEMTCETCDKFVGPMPVNEFISDFVPEATKLRPRTSKFRVSPASVFSEEEKFIDAMEESGLCPKLEFVKIFASRDRSKRKKKLDISIYWKQPDDKHDSERGLDFKALDLWIKNNNKGDDIFRTLTELKEDEKEDDLWTNAAYKICGQLTAYATALHHSRFRVFSFGVVLFGEKGRLLRWDRSVEDATRHSFEFIWRINFLSPVDRGYDTTVTPVMDDDDEAKAARTMLMTYGDWEKGNNQDTAKLYRFLVHDDRDVEGKLRSYITPCAIWDTNALFGRCTFGYIAYDVAKSKLVYLKDFWRTDLPRIQKEGDVYRKLHDANVPNIPALGPAGDVPSSPDHAEKFPFVVQRTKTQEYVNRSACNDMLLMRGGWCPGRPCVEPYVHYRLVLETLGRPLNTFKSTRQLCEVIRDAIVAHTAAYDRARILHRDISAANILITDSGSGMLIDWDLSKEITENDENPRQHSRTGTWQFISISRLLDPSTRPHQVSDDLESFFWVLLYQVVKCRNSTGIDFTESMKSVFDQHSGIDRKGNVTGGKGKLFSLRDGELNSSVVYDLVKTPCRDIIEDLRTLLQDYYLYIPAYETRISNARLVYEAKRERDSRVQEATKNLSSSKWILEMINGHLFSKWDVDDDSSLHKAVLRLDSAANRDRRKRKAEDSNEEKMTFNQRRKGRLPPRSTEPSRSSVWSQGTHSYSHSGTLLESSYSATRVSTRSQSTRSQSHGSKATSRSR